MLTEPEFETLVKANSCLAAGEHQAATVNDAVAMGATSLRLIAKRLVNAGDLNDFV
ncbi:hypothetical protein SDC9_159276 [bioreactor metagenome]|uniref:Uncharacterized protein n=1 Tax=bioreactor metagenome TaxID=1076179 RepID=A0A645FCG2_9ZZZZ